MAERILDRVEHAAGFPRSGRAVPEKGDEDIREKLLSPYRIVYTVDESRNVLHVTRIWHAARGDPELE